MHVNHTLQYLLYTLFVIAYLAYWLQSLLECVQDVRELIVREGFYIVHREVIRMGLSKARLFYQEYQCECHSGNYCNDR